MKKTILMGVSLLAVVATMAQGTVSMATKKGTEINAPCTDKSTGALVTGPAFLATLYWGTTADSLQPAVAIVSGVDTALAVEFRTGAAAGYLPATTVSIKGAAGGSAVYLQVRAWEAAKGATYDAASAAGGKVGMSNVIKVTLGDNAANPPTTPGSLVGLTAFSVDVGVIPEPSIIALGLLGGAALLLRRRR